MEALAINLGIVLGTNMIVGNTIELLVPYVSDLTWSSILLTDDWTVA